MTPPGRSRVAYRGPPREPGITREDVIEIVGEAMKQVVESISPEVKQVEDMTGVNLPLEDVHHWGEAERRCISPSYNSGSDHYKCLLKY